MHGNRASLRVFAALRFHAQAHDPARVRTRYIEPGTLAVIARGEFEYSELLLGAICGGGGRDFHSPLAAIAMPPCADQSIVVLRVQETGERVLLRLHSHLFAIE